MPAAKGAIPVAAGEAPGILARREDKVPHQAERRPASKGEPARNDLMKKMIAVIRLHVRNNKRVKVSLTNGRVIRQEKARISSKISRNPDSSHVARISRSNVRTQISSPFN